MPIQEENFYTITGELIDRTTLVQKMIDYFNDKYPDSQITDFNEGSEIRNFLEAIAVDIYHLESNQNDVWRACFISTSFGQYLDLFGQDLSCPRDMGAQAWGTLTFSIPEAISNVVTIPYGTVITSSTTGLNYVTSIDCTIDIGETSVDCPAHSQVQGANTNAEEDTLTIFRDVSPYPYLLVTNTNSFTGGRDSETDDEYRLRLLAAKTQDSFGSKEYYIQLGESIEGVHDILLVDATGYTAKVIVNGKTKPVPDSVLANVTAAFTDERNLVYNHSFTCEKVTYTTAPLEVEISVTEEISTTELNKALTALFDGGNYNGAVFNGLKIDESLSSYLIVSAIEMIPGVLQVTDISSDGDSFTKLTPGTNKVLKLGTVTATQNVET